MGKTVRAEECAGRDRDTHVILGSATDVAAFTLDALPAVGLHCCHHHGCELQARRMPCAGEEQVKQEMEMGEKRGDLADCDSHWTSQEPLRARVLAVAALALGST